jgi:2-oxo-4-hydroxy-4-carboxy-5-ureidoimidazoline decarboxylase
VNAKLAAWNAAPEAEAIEEMLACCGARRWAEAMVAARPIRSVEELSVTADRLWSTMGEADWMEAFACHPRIGERKAAIESGQSAEWSQQEQSLVNAAEAAVRTGLAERNELYEERFGFTYIVCATGKSATEMLAILNRRLNNDRGTELREAAEQQRQIMQIRLGKWLIQ